MNTSVDQGPQARSAESRDPTKVWKTLGTQTLNCNQDGSPQRGSEIYSSHLLFLQTVAAERASGGTDVHKSSPALESIMCRVPGGSLKLKQSFSIRERVTVADEMRR